ncbi:MAG: gamma-glutamyl-gamma-aminobutyrate hydrolase family protein [Deltaproteobacteria bacterium]
MSVLNMAGRGIHRKVNRMRIRWLLPIFSAVLSLTLITTPTGAVDRRTVDHETPTLRSAGRVKAQPVWVVVNLFTGQTSKQAVRIRDTLAGLGAEGRGIVLPFSAVTVERIAKLQPTFLALSPNGMPWCRYRGKNGVALANFLRALRIIVEQMRVPVIGVCGGHQALVLAFGGKVAPIRGGEDDCLPYGKNPTERGRHSVEVIENDPIFVGLGKTLNMVENHYDEVKRLPSGFLWLAANDTSRYQIVRHPTRPAYGVQAHCEYYHASRPDGGLLLRNFLKIARTHNRLVRQGTVPTRPRGPTARAVSAK